MQRITLRNLNELPSPSRFRELCMANAALDAGIMPDWQFRYFSYNSRWGTDEEMGSLRDGCGSHHYVLFTPDGVFVKGYDVGSSLNTPRENDAADWRTSTVPAALRGALGEPAFEMSHISYCLWSLGTTGTWSGGNPPSADLMDVPLGELHLLLDDPEQYTTWATDYYEQAVPTSVVRDFQQLRPVEPQMVELLNVDATWSKVVEEMVEIGFPVGD